MASDRRRVALVGGAAVVIGLVTGFLLGSDRGKQPVGEIPRNEKVQQEDPGPSGEVEGIPVGYSQTKEGAVAAAANFNLLSGRDDLLAPDALAAAMQRLAAPEWQEEAAKQAKSGYDFVLSTYGSDADVRTAVLGYDVVDFSQREAVIDLWTVSVLSGAKQPNANQVWGIVTIRLKWVGGDWRIAGIESSPGPAPLEVPSARPTEAASGVLEDFSEFTGPPIP